METPELHNLKDCKENLSWSMRHFKWRTLRVHFYKTCKGEPGRHTAHGFLGLPLLGPIREQIVIICLDHSDIGSNNNHLRQRHPTVCASPASSTETNTLATLPAPAAVVEAERVEDFLRWKEHQGVRVEGGHHPERGVSTHLEDNVVVEKKS